MKARFKNGLSAYSGKADGIVYCYNRYLNAVYVRVNVYPTLTQENTRIGSTTSNLFGITPSRGYKDDMSDYLLKYRCLRANASKSIFTWPNLYIKLMYDMAKQLEGIDLRSLTRDEIYLNNLPCISVKSAVEAGLLPAVYDYAVYDHMI
ncbi:MAG: hypothetical protein CVU48_07815 [Candidatus Cloacimonetes bacterium HGW-Cloacimonetes-1]|jgi:hypothetical protein|nr:MAG: hypothetical protein CVU48_07815 [Candidatus Cloacimonetes bacterium HGW-Cloacimonetes-1]